MTVPTASDVKVFVPAKDFGPARVAAPEMQDYGALVTFVWDPCGVLLHFAQSVEQT